MITCTSIAALRGLRATLPQPVGLVPTMGALHAGHESLLIRAAEECRSVVASIYVNPLQFGPTEDFASYPRTMEADAAALERLGITALFAPDDADMYPSNMQIAVDPGDIARHLEGARRPGHFRGVATVVLKLFNIVAPDRAYFGFKDAQQLAVIRKMVTELNLPIEIVACPTVREPDGLALSSRNRYLSDSERRNAAGLSKALKSIANAAEHGESDAAGFTRTAERELGALRIDYIAVVDPLEFVPLETLPPHAELLAVGAAYCGATRLIDAVAFRSA